MSSSSPAAKKTSSRLDKFKPKFALSVIVAGAQPQAQPASQPTSQSQQQQASEPVQLKIQPPPPNKKQRTSNSNAAADNYEMYVNVL